MSRVGLPLAVLALMSALTTASSALAHPAASAMTASSEIVESVDRTAPGVLPDLAVMAAGDRQTATPAGSLADAAIGFGAGVLVLLAMLRRDTVAVATALAALVLIFENGVHSVHHVGDEQGASECAVMAGTTHLAGASAEPPSLEAFRVLVAERLAASTQPIPACRTFRPYTGRAPPA